MKYVIILFEVIIIVGGKDMINKLLKFKLNRQLTKLQKKMKKQKKEIESLLDKLEKIEEKGTEIVLNK